MSVQTVPIRLPSISARWRPRLILLFIVAWFAVPLAAAWLLVGRWHPAASVQHGQLLDPARPLAGLGFNTSDGRRLDETALRGRWALVYAGPAGPCDSRCHTALYDIRQVRLALGKDMGRVATMLLLDGVLDAGLARWLAAEHAAMTVGATDPATQRLLAQPFDPAGATGDWIYLIDPLGNLLMRYPVTVEPRGILKDLQRLLKWSKIG